jgi:hypothetical protein
VQRKLEGVCLVTEKHINNLLKNKKLF